MSWNHVIGHADVKRVLEKALERPAPGYLFYGPSGIGKTALAHGFARMLLDHSIEKSMDAHPDFLELIREPSAKQIGVDAVRELVGQMYMSPALGKRRVALIHEADLLNNSASNSLLKSVEEPKANNVYLLTAASYERIPETLRSRLVALRMRPRASDDLAGWLMERGTDEERSREIALLSGGCPGRAKRMAENAPLWDARRKLVETVLDACNEKTGARVEALQAMKKAMEKEDDPVQGWKECLELAMRLASTRVQDPKRFAEVAEGLILSWHYVGGAISPEMGLEWTAVRTSFINKSRYTPNFLFPTYL